MDISKLYFVALAFVISALAGWIAIPQIIVISKRKRLFDEINERKVHVNAISRLGGLSFFPGAMFAFTFSLGLRYYTDLGLLGWAESMLLTDLMFLLAGLFVVFMIGLADDLVGVNYRYKFMAQGVAGLLLVFAGLGINDLQGLLGVNGIPWWVGAVVTVVFTVFVLNAFNMIDGVDGLCSSLCSLILIAIGSWYLYTEYYVYAMFAFAMQGILTVFFVYNFFGRRLKVFMGDTGSLTLGFMIVFLCLRLLRHNDTLMMTMSDHPTFVLHNSLAVLIGFLFLPAFDVLRVFVNRMSQGKSPFHPDKTHIHHKLLALGFAHRRCTLVVWIMAFCYAVLNLVMSEVLLWNVNIIVAVDILLATLLNLGLNKRVRCVKQKNEKKR